MTIGTGSHPLRVAVVGSGPAGFYAVEHLFKQPDLAVDVDMFDRLPTPYGLVRYGVAPDHLKIKTVTRAYDAIAANPRFRFFGNVEFGRHVTLADLEQHYHQVLFATGAQTDRRMGIPGEDLPGSHPATEFVAWYNGHPDYRDRRFDLSVERAAVVGVGNVAIDVARILVRTPEELAKTDIAAHALEALRRSRIKEVFLLGRRGPAQAAFTNPELKEIGEMADADVSARPEEVELDPLSLAQLEASDDRTARRRRWRSCRATRGARPRARTGVCTLRFLVSPVELAGGQHGRVTRMRLVRNTLVASADGTLSAMATEQFEDLDVGLVFRSVGYRGVPLQGVPFHERWGVVLNDKGRVIDPETKRAGDRRVRDRLDQARTERCHRHQQARLGGDGHVDAGGRGRSGVHWQPTHPEPAAAAALVQLRQPLFVTYADWKRLDALELEHGKACGRPRLKFTTVDEMMTALGRTVPTP